MNFESVPVIRLEIEHLKHTIVSALGARGSELADALEDEIEKAVKNYPIEQEVERIVRAQITDGIESYFRYGNGRKTIDKTISAIFDGDSNENR